MAYRRKAARQNISERLKRLQQILFNVRDKKGQVWQQKGHLDQAEIIFRHNLHDALETHDTAQKLLAYRSLGWLLILKTEYRPAIQCYQGILDIAAMTHDFDHLYHAWSHLELIYTKLNDADGAYFCQRMGQHYQFMITDSTEISRTARHLASM